MSEHPVGATWKWVEKKKPFKTALIWLERRDGALEVWYWTCTYSDGSRPLHWFDWNPSYRLCKQELPVDCRMKRIK